MSWKEVEESIKFWDNIPVGELVEGMLLEKTYGNFGTQYVIACKDGTKIRTPAHKNLQDKLDQLKLNELVRIKYVGSKKTSHPNDIEIYKVELWDTEKK